MKTIKNGKIYDTEQAEKICKYSNGLGKRDFRHLRETLYKTEKGNYFLYGTGGPKTKYSTRTANGTSGGKEIKPVSKNEVLDWAEKRGVDVETIEDEFKDQLEQA
jgi:hypothetical protein